MSQNGFNNALHYLRCLAALSIVIFHASEPLEVFGTGLRMFRIGSDIFFVLSGFLIWQNIMKHQPGSFDFLLKRVLRLAPLYWLITIIAVLLALLKPKLFWMVDSDVEHVVFSLFFIPDYNHNGLLFPSLLNGWMINHFIFLYVLVALGLYLPPQKRLIALTLLVAVIAMFHQVFDGEAPGSPKIAFLDAYTSPLLLEFIGGMWIAQMIGEIKSVRTSYIVMVVLFALCAILATGYLNHSAFWSYRFIVFGIPACLLVVSAALWDRTHTVIHIPFFKQIGDASYSMYLVQFLVLAPVIHVMRDKSTALCILFSLVAVILVSLALYRYVEVPLSNWVRSHIKPRRTIEAKA